MRGIHSIHRLYQVAHGRCIPRAAAAGAAQVVFLATGNSLATIPPPLLDRLEVIHLSGYTLDEKARAARPLLPLPSQLFS